MQLRSAITAEEQVNRAERRRERGGERERETDQTSVVVTVAA